MSSFRLEWIGTAEPFPTVTNPLNFGYQVCQAAEGALAFVGAPLAPNGSGNGQAFAYATTDQGATWIQQYTVSPLAATLFGAQVACSADGSHLIVGGQTHQYIYVDLPATLVPAFAADRPTCTGVAMSASGATVAVAQPGEIDVYYAADLVTYVNNQTILPGGTMEGGVVMNAEGTLLANASNNTISVYQSPDATWVTYELVAVLDPALGTAYGDILAADTALETLAISVTDAQQVTNGLVVAVLTYGGVSPAVAVHDLSDALNGATLTGLCVSPDGTYIVAGALTAAQEGVLYVLHSLDHWATHATVQAITFATTPALTDQFRPARLFSWVADTVLVGNPTTNVVNAFRLVSAALPPYACDNVIGAPAQDEAFNYAAQQTSAVSGRPPSDAAFSRLRVGQSRAFGWTDRDRAWTHFSTCA